MQALNMATRSFNHMNIESCVTMYRAYVRFHLELCVHEWSPYLAKHIDNLEKFHRSGNELVSNIAKLTYEDILRHMGLYSLHCRRQRGDLIETFTILNG